MGFPNVPGNQNFVQGQVTTSVAGTPVVGTNPQVQNTQGMAHTGKHALYLYDELNCEQHFS